MAGLAGLSSYLAQSPGWQQSLDMLKGSSMLAKEREMQLQEAQAQLAESTASKQQYEMMQGGSARIAFEKALADGVIDENDIRQVVAVDPEAGKKLWDMMLAQRKAQEKDIRVNPVTGEWNQIDQSTGVVSPAQMGGATPSDGTVSPPIPVQQTDIPGSSAGTFLAPTPPAGLNPAERKVFMEESIKAGIKGQTEAKAKEVAKSGFSKSLETMRSMVDSLNKIGGMINTDKPEIENLAVAAKQTSIGQAYLTRKGDKTQAQRDKIKAYIPVLMRDIKAATGMSAQEVNSIPEMKMLQDSVGNPDVSYQAVKGILANLDEKYGSGKPAKQEGVVMTHPTLGEVTEDDITTTMRKHGLTREQVLQRLGVE